MEMTPSVNLFVLALPLLMAAGAVLAFANATVEAARQHARMAALAVAAATGLLALFAAGVETTLSASQLILCALAVLAGSLSVAGLLDRARLGGLLVAGALLGVGTVQCLFGVMQLELPAVPRVTLPLAAAVMAAMAGMVGSMLVPPHPKRLGETYYLVPLAVLGGWLLLAMGVAGTGWLMEETPRAPLPLAVTALVAMLVGLLTAQRARHPMPLRVAGEATLAGVLLALASPLSLSLAALMGIVAAHLVWQGPRMARALGLDDPAHVLGAVLLPALGGLLLPGLLQLDWLGEHLTWVGGSLLAGLVLGLGVWLVVKFFVGLSAAPKRVREGLDHY